MNVGGKKFYYSDKNVYCFSVPDQYRCYIDRGIAKGRIDGKNAAGADDMPEKAYRNIGFAENPEKKAAAAEIQLKRQREAKSAPVQNRKSTALKNASGVNKKNITKKPQIKTNLIIRIAAICIMIFSVIIIADKSMEYIRDIEYNKAINSDFQLKVNQNSLLAKRDTPSYPEIAGSETVRIDYPVVYDTESLKQLALAYPDFVFCLYIENTTVQYPVVQAADNEYYLRKNMDGETNLSGTLFLDFRNDRDKMRGNNIVYGHNMQNGTMFGLLKKYRDKSYYDSHSMIYTYTGEEVTAWKIFSAYVTTTENYYIETYFDSNEDYLSFLNKLKADSLYDTGVSVTAQDDILTLSTCHKYGDKAENGRFVVHAVRVGSSPLA